MCLLAQSKEGQRQFKNKKQPELTENWTVWKSHNQADKEKTFIQTSRRGGEGQLGWRGLTAILRLADPTAPHSHIDKPDERRGAKQTSQPKAPAWGNKASNLIENTRGVEELRGSRNTRGSRRNSKPHRRVCWRDPQGPRACTSLPTWESAPEGSNLIVGSERSD